MISKNKIYILATFLFFIFLCLIEFVALRHYQKNNINESCSSTFELLVNKKEFKMPAEIIFDLNPNGDGLINLRGSFNLGSNEYVISRVIKFRYVVSENNKSRLILSDFNIIKYASDTMDDSFFNSEVLDFSTGKNLYVIIQRFHGMFIIGNPFSPVFICIKDKAMR